MGIDGNNIFTVQMVPLLKKIELKKFSGQHVETARNEMMNLRHGKSGSRSTCVCCKFNAIIQRTSWICFVN